MPVLCCVVYQIRKGSDLSMPVVSMGFGHRDLVTAGTRLSGSHWCLAVWCGLAGGQQLHNALIEEIQTVYCWH